MESKARQAESISFADFTETTLAAVTRAIAARTRDDRPLGPVLIGIIWWPDGGPQPNQPGLPPNPITPR